MHGGSLAEARRLFPRAPAPWLDLSTGINPVPYAVGAIPQDTFARLPEPADVAALERAAAAAYGVDDPHMVVAAPGTQALIALLPRLCPAPRVGVLGPTYAEHARAWALAGAAVETVSDTSALTQFACAVLCNPNNPDGRRLAPAQVLDLAASGRTLVVDEAFADFEPESLSVAGAAAEGLIVLRSFGKTYGLAGLRLGFAITSPARAAALRAALGPWAVSGPALAVGLRALADAPWRAAAAARLAADARALDAVLTGAGLRVAGGTALFRLAETAEADRVFSRLGAQGIYVRRFADRPHWLRFGQCPDDAALERLAAALRAA
jgi:cobalamin biosynthetic protein CobC